MDWRERSFACHSLRIGGASAGLSSAMLVLVIFQKMQQDQTLTTDLYALLYTTIGALTTLGVLELIGSMCPMMIRRKLVHIGMGPVYIMFWNLFGSEGWTSRMICAIVPGILTIYFVLLGLGLARNDKLVGTLSRSGKYMTV